MSDTNTNTGGMVFDTGLNQASVARALARRAVDRHYWDGIRGVRRNAWIVLHDRECPKARAFVNEALAPTFLPNPTERLRNARLRALRNALTAINRSTRLMELAVYRHLRNSAEKVAS